MIVKKDIIKIAKGEKGKIPIKFAPVPRECEKRFVLTIKAAKLSKMTDRLEFKVKYI